MRNVYIGAVLFVTVMQATAQNFSLDEMVSLTNYNSNKLDKYLSKKGFRTAAQEANNISYTYQAHASDTAALVRCIKKHTSRYREVICFDKVTASEYANLLARIKQEGFTQAIWKGSNDTVLFQKDNLTIYFIKDTVATADGPLYTITIESRVLPRPRNMQYAEDLLAFNSHQQLVSVFGSGNVVKDVFIGPDGQQRICSVLFPNSSREAVFIWNDGEGYRNTRLIRIGGYAQTKGAMEYTRPVVQSSWVSSQGLYVGMSLKELDEKNGKEIDFYGWDWNSGGVLTSNNNGRINFSKISLILSCFNCTDPDYYRNRVNSSTSALEENRKIHIATLIILPQPEE